MKIGALRIEPSPTTGLTVPSGIMIFQMRAIDKARIVRQIGQLTAADLARVDAEIRNMLFPPLSHDQ